MEGKNGALTLAWKYMQYWFASVNEHGIHSPFVFDWVQNLLYDQTPYYAFEEIEKLRGEHKINYDTIIRQDFGAGSRVLAKETSVASIARSQLISSKFAQLLFKQIVRSQPKYILEMGTSLGISTAYLAKANSKAEVVSMEGDAALASIARMGLEKLAISNASIWEGNFDDLLPKYLQEHQELDFVYLDGNHTYAASMRYWKMLLPKLHENSVVVLDDIRWSKGMEKAWQEIQNSQQVGISIDLFRMGILFFKQDQRKQDFVIRF